MKTRRNTETETEEVSYWLSYSDMMAALLLVFVLIISFTMLQARLEYEEKTAQIVKQQETIDRLIGVKGDIINALVVEFDDSGLAVKIDESTGAIMFDSELLFDPNKSILKQNSKDFLDSFLPKYFTILLGDRFKDSVAEIIIEGHTAEFGTYMACLQLSQSRAFSVANYAVRDDSVLKDYIDLNDLRSVLTVNGRAYFDPIYDKDGNYDMIASRRVEIKFRLKNEDIIDEMKKVMGQ